MQYFRPTSFVRQHIGNKPEEHALSSTVRGSQMKSNLIKLYAIPLKKKDENPRAQHESYVSALWKLRDQVLSLSLDIAYEKMPHKYRICQVSLMLLYFFLSCRAVSFNNKQNLRDVICFPMSDFVHEVTIFHEISLRAGMVKELCQDMGTG